MTIKRMSQTSLKAVGNHRKMMAGSLAFSDMELITTSIVSSSVGSVTFNSNVDWSQYKHLQIRYTGVFTTYGAFNMTFNGDTNAANYYHHNIYSTGGGVGAGYSASAQISYQWNGGVNGTIVDIMDAFSSVKNKTSKAMSGNTIVGAGTNFFASHLWNSLSPINSITISHTRENLPVGSRFSLYGIRG